MDSEANKQDQQDKTVMMLMVWPPGALSESQAIESKPRASRTFVSWNSGTNCHKNGKTGGSYYFAKDCPIPPSAETNKNNKCMRVGNRLSCLIDMDRHGWSVDATVEAFGTKALPRRHFGCLTASRTILEVL